MTTEQIKEQLSIHYLGALASRAGHLMKMPTGNPTGVDVTISEFQKIEIEGRTRHIDTGNAIDVQLKCTSRNKRLKPIDLFHFDLEVKNYNDLVWRRKHGNEIKTNPLLLILLVLPKNHKDWLKTEINESLMDGFLTLGGIAYWYFPKKGDEFTANKKKQKDFSFLREIK